MNEPITVNTTQMRKTIDTLLEVVKKQAKNDLTSNEEAESIYLQLCLKKIPNVQNKTVKIVVPHPLVQRTSDICLFVKDLDKSQRDVDTTITHFKDLLKKNGIEEQIEVIPLKTLKLEYKPYEAKKNLSNMYDIYLADERIVRLLPAILGKHFIGRKRFPVQVNLRAVDLKKEIKRALSVQHFCLSGRGSACQMKIAHTKMSSDQIANNIDAALTKLAGSLPGGATNVKNMHLKTEHSPALPVHVSLGKASTIKMEPRAKFNAELEADEVSTVHDALVKITRSGRVKLQPVLKQDDEAHSEVTETKTKRTKRKAKEITTKGSDKSMVHNSKRKRTAFALRKKKQINTL